MEAKLMKIIQKNDLRSVSVIGMAKNTGKTETVKYLIRCCTCMNKILGITSVGLDGERKDQLTSQKKPLIWLPKDHLLATAESCLIKLHSQVKILEDTGFHNALGRIFLACMKEAGSIELAGPAIKEELKITLDMFNKYGVDLVVVDGALDRVSAAGSQITSGTILCTGSVVAQNLAEIAWQTVARFEQLSVPKVPQHIRTICYEAFKKSKIACLTEDLATSNLYVSTVVGNESKIISFVQRAGKVKYLAMDGAITNNLLELFTFNSRTFEDIQLIIRSGTTIFVDYQTWDRFKKNHGMIFVLEPINVVAITINPFAEYGTKVDSDTLKAVISKHIKSVPIIDVLR